MSNSDYVVLEEGPLCTVAELSAGVNYTTDTFPLVGLSEAAPGDRYVGMACMVDDEICKVTEINPANVKVTRGCADTVPATHASGALVWFFEQAVGDDGRVYAATDEIGVKLLAQTNSGIVPVEASPPQELIFNFRFARPYAPGLMRVNGSAWHAVTAPVSISQSMVLTWVHRDRVLQADQLVAHGDASVGPEPGTTYTVYIYDDADVLKGTHSGIVATTFTYDFAMAAADFGISYGEAGGLHNCHAYVVAHRDALDSYQGYAINFTLDRSGITAGWGYGWGFGFGDS